MRFWVSSRRDERIGYDVREGREGYLLGWVRFDRSEGSWRATCRGRLSSCEASSPQYTRAEALDELAQHIAIEHR